MEAVVVGLAWLACLSVAAALALKGSVGQWGRIPWFSNNLLFMEFPRCYNSPVVARGGVEPHGGEQFP